MILSKQKNKLFSLFRALFVRPSPNRRKFFVLGTLVLVLLLFVPRPAYAFVGGELVIGVLWAIAFVCKTLVSLAATALAFMLRGDIYYFSNEPMILAGWKICRDICNLFFLLILIFIAFCTILQIDKYHAKKTLLTLIIMALLINFSKPIAIFIFDGSQLLMNYFLNATSNWTVTITNLSKIADTVYNALPAWYSRWNPFSGGMDDGQMIAMQITTIIFLFMYAVALFVMAIYLFIRLVALWILIIVSPFAFLLAAVPDFKKYSDEWWSTLFKYCYVGPILAFFLYLSTKLADSKFLQLADSKSSTAVDNIISLGNIIHFIVVLVFLYASIIMAQKFGIAFASGITSAANKAIKMGTGFTAAKWGGRKAWQGAKWGAKKGGKWFDREFLAKGVNVGGKNYSLSPKVWATAWSNKTKEREEDVYGDAQAQAAEHLNQVRFLKAGKKIPDFYKRKREAEKDAKYQKEQDSMGTAPEIILPELKKLLEDKAIDPIEKQSRMRAYMNTLTRSRDYNEGIKQKWLEAIFGKNKVMDAGEAPENTAAIFSAFGMTDPKDQAYYAKRLGEIAMANDDYHLWAMEEKNKKKRMAMMYGKIGTIPEKKLAIGMHSEALHIKNDNGDVVGIPITSPVFLKRWGIMGFDKINEARAQVKSDTLTDGGIKAHYKEYARLLDEAKTYDSQAESARTPLRREIFKRAAETRRQQANDQKTWVQMVATEGSKTKSREAMQRDVDRISQHTNGVWTFEVKEGKGVKGAKSKEAPAAESAAEDEAADFLADQD